VPGAENAKMPLVKSGKLWLAKAFDYSKDGSIYEADVGVRVPYAELMDTEIVSWRKVFNQVRAGEDVLK